MRLIAPVVAFLSASAALAGDAPQGRAPATAAPPVVVDMPQVRGAQPARCRDAIHDVRAERGLPDLRRETATPGQELALKAVDHRIDGCSVMVMHHDTRDIRPLSTEPGTPQLRKIQ